MADSERPDSTGVATSVNTLSSKVQVKPVSNLQDIRHVMVRYCQQMTDEAQKQLNSLLLSDVTLEHILKIHRGITMTRYALSITWSYTWLTYGIHVLLHIL